MAYHKGSRRGWIEEVHVDAEDLKDVWFIVDHFHSIKGMAHTYLTFEFGSGTCLPFPLNHDVRRANAITRGTVCGGLTNSTCWSASSVMSTGLRTHGRRNRDYMFRANTPPKTRNSCLP